MINYNDLISKLSNISSKDTLETSSEITHFIWHRGEIISNCPSKQIYGFCFTPELEIVLVRDHDESRFTLPGGGVDKGESPRESLIREFEEEAQFVPENIAVLGSLEVIRKDRFGKLIDHHQQVRYKCNVDDMGEFIPQKDGWETEERITVSLDRLDKYLEWLNYPTGQAIFRDLIDLIQTRNEPN